MSTNRDHILAYILGAGGIGLCLALSYGLYLEWQDRKNRRQRSLQRQLKRKDLRRKGGR